MDEKILERANESGSIRVFDINGVKSLVLVDSSFLFYMFERPDKLKEFFYVMKKHPYRFGLTSFNLEEIFFVYEKKKVSPEIRREFRSFFKLGPMIAVVDVPVSPGSADPEKKFVEFFDPEILKLCRDISDAVLVGTAIHTLSDILTKDKHHIFTTVLENYVESSYDVEIYKDFELFR